MDRRAHLPLACVIIYTISQILLVLRTLDDRWPLGDITFGLFFFAAGLILMYGFGEEVCRAVKHYIDGTFFGSLCMLLAVMMVYKYWIVSRRKIWSLAWGASRRCGRLRIPFLLRRVRVRATEHWGWEEERIRSGETVRVGWLRRKEWYGVPAVGWLRALGGVV